GMLFLLFLPFALLGLMMLFVMVHENSLMFDCAKAGMTRARQMASLTFRPYKPVTAAQGDRRKTTCTRERRLSLGRNSWAQEIECRQNGDIEPGRFLELWFALDRNLGPGCRGAT
ncbi:MAG TPA: hypothetical protein VNC50_08980, partial [Planctomycetia bacterium]|nr:hypothetical protein [Planctomycetia bacterium]